MTVRIRRAAILKWHLIAISFLFAMHVATLLCAKYQVSLDWGFTRLFNVNAETNIPTFFSVMAIAAAAMGAFWCSAVVGRSDPSQRRGWKMLGWLLVFVAFDEGSQIHETLGDAIAVNLGASDAGYSWVLVYAGVVAVVAALLIRFWLSLERALQFLFAAGGVVYVGSAMGLEVAEALVVRRFGQDAFDNSWVGVLSAFEECGEMLGIAILLQGVLLFIEKTGPQLAIRLGGAVADGAGGHGGSSPPRRMVDSTIALVVAAFERGFRRRWRLPAAPAAAGAGLNLIRI